MAVALVAAALAPVPSHAATALRVYPLGDSITYGSTYPSDTPGGYRGYLDGLLTDDGVTHNFVGVATDNSSPVLDQEGQSHHDGHPGYRIDQDAADLDGLAHAYDDTGGYWLTGVAGGRLPIFPDVTVIHLGTNDVVQRYDAGTTYPTGDGKVDYTDAAQRATFVAHLTARLQSLVDKVHALRPGCRIVLSTILPIGLANEGQVTIDYNDAIASLVAAERAAGARIVLADAWSAFATETPDGQVVVSPALMSQDTVHPTPLGYAAMARVYADAVEAVLTLS
jgi:lysophospholipase L1-like esterase